VSGFVHPAVQQALRQRWRDSRFDQEVKT